MDTRLIVAYALILFMALAFVSIIVYATREGRARRRADRAHRRQRKARRRAEASA